MRGSSPLVLLITASGLCDLASASLDGAVWAQSGATFLGANFLTDRSHLLQARQSSNCSLPAPNIICSDQQSCCPASQPLCCPNLTCCPTNTACISGQVQLCCPSTAETCGRDDFCLGRGQSCCGKIAGGSGYCNAGYECLTAASGEQACCLPGNIACSSTLCCPSGTQCATNGVGCAAAAPQTNSTSGNAVNGTSNGNSSSSSSRSLSGGAIAGIAIGAALAVALIALALFFCLRRHRKKVYKPAPYDSNAQMYQTGPAYPHSPSTATYVQSPTTADGTSYAHSLAPTATSYPQSPHGAEIHPQHGMHEFYQTKPPQEMDGNKGTFELEGSSTAAHSR